MPLLPPNVGSLPRSRTAADRHFARTRGEDHHRAACRGSADFGAVDPETAPGRPATRAQGGRSA